MTYTFTGSAVSIFGTLGPSQGPYQVQLDGGAAQNFTATNTAFHAQSLLYRADNLDNSQHTGKNTAQHSQRFAHVTILSGIDERSKDTWSILGY